MTTGSTISSSGKAGPDAAERYARNVAAGKIPASKWAGLACVAHLRELDDPYSPWAYDRAAADHACEFVERFLRHSKGKWGGERFVLSPWQHFIVRSLFGWKGRDGLRRFREAYIEIPRKNGKTTLLAAILLYLLCADGEPGAEVYSAATKKDQARICFDEAVRMVKKSPALAKRVQRYAGSLVVEKTDSKFVPLGADADSLDGLNTSGVGIDELHAHKQRGLYDVLSTAGGSRSQPLLVAITTAGVETETICGEVRNYCCDVLSGNVPPETGGRQFGYIATIDDADEWDTPKAWHKANPNIGVSVSEDKLREDCNKAKARGPAARNAFKRYHLNLWTSEGVGWIDPQDWNVLGQHKFARADLAGLECFVGLDMANTLDVAAVVAVFPGDDVYRWLGHYFVPEEYATERERKLRELFKGWAASGHVTMTPGDEIDYATVEEYIFGLADEFNIVELAYDPYNAGRTAQVLAGHGIEVVKFQQNVANYNPACQAIEGQVRSRRIAHNGDPVLAWMVRNAKVRVNGLGYIMPDRKKSAGKIDGLVAGVMATGQAMTHTEDSVWIDSL